MFSQQEIRLLENVFMFNYFTQRARVRENNLNFAHYTSAENAFNIFQSKEFWMRRSSLMNDFSEIKFGEFCIQMALEKHRDIFVKLLDEINPDLRQNILERTNQFLEIARENSFIASFVEHDSKAKSHDNEFGRLSMWRAYGGANGIALVFDREQFFREDRPNIGAMTSPVQYCTVEEFDAEFLKFIERAESEKNELKNLDAKLLIHFFSFTLLHFILLAKHRGFEEEREWRLIYSPVLMPSKHITESVEVIRGIPQKVCQLPLTNAPEIGVIDFEISDLLLRFIIGPSNFPQTILETFNSKLKNLNVDVDSVIQLSSIPLRT